MTADQIVSAGAEVERSEGQRRSWLSVVGPMALGALADLRAERQRIEAQEQMWVAEARKHGASWQDIGNALGTARQNAWRKYREKR